MGLSSSQYAPETDRFLRPRRHNKIDSLPPVWRSSALLRDQLLAELGGLGSRRLHFRAWSRANTLVPAAADKVREAFQVRLADPKRLPIPLGREVPFAPLRGPWNLFVCAGAVDPWEPFFFSGGPFFGSGSTF